MTFAKKVAIGLLAGLLYTIPLVAAQSSFQLIEDAFRTGQLTNNERLILLTQSIREPQLLPDQYRSSQPEVRKSATSILVEVQANWDNFSNTEKAVLRELLARPSQAYSFDSPSGHFKIHYDLSGTDAVPSTDNDPADGVPDYVNWLGDYADSSYRAEVVNLGELEPPIDYGFGGDNKYDIYTEDMPYYGYTQPEGPGSQAWSDYYSYVSVENNFYGFPSNDDPEGNQKGAMKVTVAHEYNHAIQMGYEVDFGSDTWFMELSSTWSEEWVFPTVNDNYNYLYGWFSYPYYSLHSTSGVHPYAAFIWGRYLEQNFGGTIMEEIWSHTIDHTPYEDLAAAIAAHGSTLEDEFAEFCVWNYITSSYNDGLHYEDAADYPHVQLVRTHVTFPVSGQTPTTSQRPDAMGENYVVFVLPSGEGSFTVDFNGDNSTPWRVVLLTSRYSGGYVYGEQEIPLDANGDGSYTINDPENWSRVIMVVVNESMTLDDRNYTYGATFTPYSGYAVDVRQVADDSVYSNTTGQMKFAVENTGSYSDVFNIDVNDGLGWTVSPSTSGIFLNPGQVDSVDVSAICPAMVTEGTVNTIYLTASATSAAGVVDQDSCSVLVFVQRGDADNNGMINISDATYIVSYIFGGGSSPVPILEAGDASCDGIVNVSDAVALVGYIFGGGQYPPCNPL
jgi:hypothetical protein